MWAQAIATAIGVWLYASPGILGYDGAAATSDRIMGALVISFSFVSIWEHLRGVRLANRPLAAWLIASPLFLDHPSAAVFTTIGSGAAVLALSFVRGTIEHRYGGGWRAVLRDQPEGGPDAR